VYPEVVKFILAHNDVSVKKKAATKAAVKPTVKAATKTTAKAAVKRTAKSVTSKAVARKK
jgi:hypothetical protein